MDETALIDLIDCNFPYHDQQRALDLAREACRISPSAAFMVLHELADPPADTEAELIQARMDVLDVILGELHHPLTSDLVEMTRTLMTGRQLAAEEAGALLERMAPYPETRPLLWVPATVVDDDVDTEALDARTSAIEAHWER